MVWFRGVVFGLVVLFLGAWSDGAFSFGIAPKVVQVTVNCAGAKQGGGTASGSGSTYAEACGPLLDQIKASYTDPYYGTVKDWRDSAACTATYDAQGNLNSSGQCSRSFNCGGAGICYVVAGGSAAMAESCVANSSAVGAGCVCNLGFRQEAGSTACVPYQCPKTNSVDSSYGPYSTQPSSISTPKYFCDNTGDTRGCSSSFTGEVASEGVSGWYVSGKDAYTGNPCQGTGDGTADTPAAPPEVDAPLSDVDPNNPNQANPCATGQCPGTFNGVSMCVACGKTTVEGPSATASAPSGSSTPVLSPTAPPGAVSSSTSTTCSGSGSCTTTTTYFGPNGEVLGSASEGTDKGGFCEENPASPICEESTISGSCDAVTCTGDAIQCAIAKEQAKRNCELWNQAQADHPGVLAANGEAFPDGHPMNDEESTDISFSSAIDTTNALGGGNCPSDYSFSVSGVGMSIPFSTLCPHLAILGQIVLGFSMLAAAFIVFKG